MNQADWNGRTSIPSDGSRLSGRDQAEVSGMLDRSAGPLGIRILAIAAGITLLFAAVAAAQNQETNAEALVVCPGVTPPSELTPAGFAKSTLTSLWYARSAAQTGEEISKAGKEADSWLSFLTAMMRLTKTATNDFVCAKRSILPFVAGRADDTIVSAAQLLVLVYHSHININGRALDVLTKMDSLSQSQLADQLSTLQVERGQRWADLVEPTTIALLSLVDQERSENGKLAYLVVTKAEKKHLLDWSLEKFPEFSNASPRDKWSDPAKTANLYLTFLNGRKCADEK